VLVRKDEATAKAAVLDPDGSAEGEFEVIALPKWKRAMDIVVSGLALLALAPLLGVVAILVRLDSPGPAVFRQPRIGHGGREFTCLKFRSMYVDAEERLKSLAHLNEATGHVFKIRDDPRRTRVGKILRKTSVDELPQFWNVLRGDMTLVGPRPPLCGEVEHYGPRDRMRLRGMPGITGPWQVSARENHDFEEMLDLDLAYLKNVSFTRDCRILLATVPAVLRARGSH
jgi:lipopolysaccharide/colanic/teichoic acid biosynthesis glycosyltransferase